MADIISIWNKQLGLVLVVLTIISILASAVIAYAVTNETAKHNADDIKDLQAKSDKCTEDIADLKTSIAILETVAEDVKEIKQDVKELIKGD